MNLCLVQVGIERSTLASHTNMQSVPQDATKVSPHPGAGPVESSKSSSNPATLTN